MNGRIMRNNLITNQYRCVRFAWKCTSQQLQPLASRYQHSLKFETLDFKVGHHDRSPDGAAVHRSVPVRRAVRRWQFPASWSMIRHFGHRAKAPLAGCLWDGLSRPIRASRRLSRGSHPAAHAPLLLFRSSGAVLCALLLAASGGAPGADAACCAWQVGNAKLAMQQKMLNLKAIEKVPGTRTGTAWDSVTPGGKEEGQSNAVQKLGSGSCC